MRKKTKSSIKKTKSSVKKSGIKIDKVQGNSVPEFFDSLDNIGNIMKFLEDLESEGLIEEIKF